MMRGRALLLAILVVPAGVRALSIVNSKHDLGLNSTTPGVKATAETQKCVFCHTPHRPARNVPLWNHSLTGETFTFYGSNYVNTYLGIAQPGGGTPTALPAGSRSRLCMSCHDGVTAVGGVYNLGGGAPATIDVSGVGTGPFPAGHYANLGKSLVDDHPIRYPVLPGTPGVYTRGLGTDPEIVLPPNNDAVKLYDPATGNPKLGSNPPVAGDLVECTTCHDPHDNANWNFLVKSNADADLCTTCHRKQGWTGSIHQTSVAGINPTWYYDALGTPPPPAPTTVGNWACRSCHRMHGANVASGQAYLLQGPEQDTCYACHRTGGVATRNIQTPMGYTYRHPTNAVSGRHINPETSYYNTPTTDAQNNLRNNRHAECQDCHNPHYVKGDPNRNRLSKTTPDHFITPVLLGSWGVRVTTWPTPGTTAGTNNLTAVAPANYTFMQLTNTSTDREYELCFKCHSSWALGTTPPYNGSPPSYITEQSAEFNTKNASIHPVVGTAATPNPYCNANTMAAPWNGGTHTTMMCSDCHGSANAADPEGPHGSTLDGTVGHGMLQQSLVAVANAGGVYETPLCVRCHRSSVYAVKWPGGTKGLSGFPDHPGNNGSHSVASNAGEYGGCLICHGNFTKTAPVYGTFHGSNWYWTAAHPGSAFMTNTKNFSDWVRTANGTPGSSSNSGSCTQPAGACNNHSGRTY